MPPAIQRQHQGERSRRSWWSALVIQSMGGRMQQGERQLLALYARYKHLALGTGAGLMLDAIPTELVEETRALVADCRRAAAAAPHGPLTPLFEACTGAAVALHDLVLSGREGSCRVPDERLRAVRASHSRLRREIWTVTPCEYVPCSAANQRTTERS